MNDVVKIWNLKTKNGETVGVHSGHVDRYEVANEIRDIHENLCKIIWK